MVVLTARHTSPVRHRESILERGLLPNLPHPAQFFGIYVYNDDYRHRVAYKGRDLNRTFRCRWSDGPHVDVWQVSYCGPLRPDPYVENGLILLDRPEVTLVTRNN